MRFGSKDLGREEILDLVGDVSQLVSVTPVEHTDGAARGSRALLVRTWGGVSFDVLVDRALDLGAASVAGTPAAWRSPGGDAAPAFAEHTGAGFTRTFGGGLLTTCGLSSIGQPSDDDDEHHGLHGRISTLPARDVCVDGGWVGDEYEVRVRGRIVETSLNGTTLELRRTIRTRTGDPAVIIEDVVTNTGGIPAPHMARHHINLGFPMVRPGDRIVVDAARARPRVDSAPLDAPWEVVGPPCEGADEVALGIRPVPAPGVWGASTATASVVGPDGHLRVAVEWDMATMPVLVLWKQQRARTNVVALEPSTHGDDGRAAARKAGDLVVLAPREQRHYRTRIRFGPESADNDSVPTEQEERNAHVW